MHSARFRLVATISIAFASAQTASAQTCDRACLKTTLDQYLNAVVKHDPKAAPLFEGFRQTDNGVVVNIAPPDIPTVVEQYTANHTPTITGAAKKDAGGSTYVALANGDALAVTVNGVTYSLTVGQTSSPAGLSYSNGTWSLVPASIPNGHYEVSVSATAGGITKTDLSTVELHVNDRPPVISLNPVSGGVLNAAESTQALPISPAPQMATARPPALSWPSSAFGMAATRPSTRITS